MWLLFLMWLLLMGLPLLQLQLVPLLCMFVATVVVVSVLLGR